MVKNNTTGVSYGCEVFMTMLRAQCIAPGIDWLKKDKCNSTWEPERWQPNEYTSYQS